MSLRIALIGDIDARAIRGVEKNPFPGAILVGERIEVTYHAKAVSRG